MAFDAMAFFLEFVNSHNFAILLKTARSMLCEYNYVFYAIDLTISHGLLLETKIKIFLF
jgi:hypothetical protein